MADGLQSRSLYSPLDLEDLLEPTAYAEFASSSAGELFDSVAFSLEEAPYFSHHSSPEIHYPSSIYTNTVFDGPSAYVPTVCDQPKVSNPIFNFTVTPHTPGSSFCAPSAGSHKRKRSPLGDANEEVESSSKRRRSDGSDDQGTVVAHGSPAPTHDGTVTAPGTPARVDSLATSVPLVDYSSSSSSSSGGLSPAQFNPASVYDLPHNSIAKALRHSASPAPENVNPQRGVSPLSLHYDPSLARSPASSSGLDSLFDSPSSSRHNSPVPVGGGGKTRVTVPLPVDPTPPASVVESSVAEQQPVASTSTSTSNSHLHPQSGSDAFLYFARDTPQRPSPRKLSESNSNIVSDPNARKFAKRKMVTPSSDYTNVISLADEPTNELPRRASVAPPHSFPEASREPEDNECDSPSKRYILKDNWDPTTATVNDWITSATTTLPTHRGRKAKLAGSLCIICNKQLENPGRHFLHHVNVSVRRVEMIEKAMKDAVRDGIDASQVPRYEMELEPTDVLILVHNTIVRMPEYNPGHQNRGKASQTPSAPELDAGLKADVDRFLATYPYISDCTPSYTSPGRSSPISTASSPSSDRHNSYTMMVTPNDIQIAYPHLYAQLRTIGMTPMWRCEDCGVDFSRPDALKRHRRLRCKNISEAERKKIEAEFKAASSTRSNGVVKKKRARGEDDEDEDDGGDAKRRKSKAGPSRRTIKKRRNDSEDEYEDYAF